MKTLIKFIVVAIFISSSLYAQDSVRRIEPGSRKLTKSELYEINQAKKEELKQSENLNKKESSPLISGNTYPPLIFENDTHNITGISAFGDFLVIEDGSQWRIKQGYAQEVYLWKELDPIIICLNDSIISSYFQGYKYKMINARTNTAIEVILELSPILENPYTIQVVALNPMTYEVLLSDNTYFKCDPSQYYLFQKWIPGDLIIVGTNLKKGWFNSFDNILINVNLLQEIKAQRLE
ncbi:MAG: hypothetical protein JXA94_04870 [Parachlamydiales bacterium]|nr:hypothetical protein [Parachlamydiales bacterium]